MKKFRTQRTSRTAVATTVSAFMLLALGSGYAAANSDKAAPSGNSKSGQTQLSDREAIADHAGWNDPKLADIASHGGRVLLRQLEDVNTALKVGDVDGARHALKAAEDFAQTLKPLMPYTVVTDNVRNADNQLVSADTGITVDQMLPIFGDVTTVTAYAPDQTNTPSKTSQAKSVKAQKKTAATENMAPVGEDIASQVVYMPVLFVESQAKLASQSLDKNPPDTAAASQAIAGALGSLVIDQTNVHLLPGASGNRAS